jgi:transcriptional regulator with XRE-family HTH domain
MEKSERKELNMKIGKSIKIILEATKLTRMQLAARLGIHRSQLSVLENNKSGISNIILRRITKIFKIPAIYMITASDDKFRQQFPGTYRSIKNQIETLAANNSSTSNS